MDDLILKLGTPPKPVCSYQRWLQSLSEEERDSVYAAMQNPEWSSNALTNIFRQHGATFDKKATSAHRRGECVLCGPK